MAPDSPLRSPCAGCHRAADRREFLREATGIFLSLGLSPARAAAMAITHATGERAYRGGVGKGRFEMSYPVPPADGATIDKQNELILVRYHGVAYAFALSCPHQHTALHWLDDQTGFQCPKHKSRYQPDGTFISGRATRNMDRLPIRRDGGLVFVDVEKVYESDKDAAGWAAAVVTL